MSLVPMFLKNMFTFGANHELQYEVLFGHQCAGQGEHGAIVGTWVKEGNKSEITISFFFKGMMLPPRMSIDVIEELFYHARRAGIVPTHLYSYGGLAQVRPITEPKREVPPALRKQPHPVPHLVSKSA